MTIITPMRAQVVTSKQADTIRISGVVLDENGEAVIAALVQILDANGCVIDSALSYIDGSFEIAIDADKSPQTCCCQYVGYMSVLQVSQEKSQHYQITLQALPTEEEDKIKVISMCD